MKLITEPGQNPVPASNLSLRCHDQNLTYIIHPFWKRGELCVLDAVPSAGCPMLNQNR